MLKRQGVGVDVNVGVSVIREGGSRCSYRSAF